MKVSCPALWDPMYYTVHGILQARILEWVAFPFSRVHSQPRDQTQVSQVSRIAGRFFTSWATGKPKDTEGHSLSFRRLRLRKRRSGFPGGASGKKKTKKQKKKTKKPACQCRTWKRHGFNPWIGKIPWRRAWQHTPVFLPGEFHGQRILVCYSP